ncbi:Pyruvate dehydrogenase phosphatase regulatory subunit, mitochondrial [Trichinella pseudospiralis]|uniref:Pyruvate dehydrogenase phosphatase regulatory subunit, mitochondrial n=1 Tax=Trichinella pseudospiralis TaxID=6337 RepID=A0A0V1FKL3_TRIPS|nr:Pyruvate dehydrogenase phosphatase regulatory subunit, mitochondrial [Trichinella pseudospiralis]
MLSLHYLRAANSKLMLMTKNAYSPRRCFRQFASGLSVNELNLSMSDLPFRSYEYEDLIEFPEKVDVLICGGGLSGLCLAYHLSAIGKHKILLLERNRLSKCATMLSTGLLLANQTWRCHGMLDMVHFADDFYNYLSKQQDIAGYSEWSRMLLASTEATALQLKRILSIAKASNFNGRLLSPEELKKLDKECQIGETKAINIKSDIICYAALLLDDVRVNQYASAHVLASMINRTGVDIVENCAVRFVKLDNQCRVIGAETDYGFVECDAFVDAAGAFSGSFFGHDVDPAIKQFPLHPLFYNSVVLEAEGIYSFPSTVVHDVDLNVYVSHSGRYLVCGGFDKHAFKLDNEDSLLLYGAEGSQLPEQWDFFVHVLEKLAKRFPALLNLPVARQFVIGEAFTPDGLPVLGALPSVPNYYCLTGMNGLVTTMAPGLSKVLAQRICGIEPELDVDKFDVSRFILLHCNKHYISQRATEVAGSVFSNFNPLYEWSSVRRLRLSPLHEELKEAGGVFGEVMGFEQVLYFSKGDVPWMKCGESFPLGKPEWFDHVAVEYRACREKVAIMEMSYLSKFEVKGQDYGVIYFLQKMCSANVDQPIGSAIFTGIQNYKGGYVADCTLNRFGQYEFFITAAPDQQTRLRIWMQRHLTAEDKTNIHDVTSKYTTLCILGPASRMLMQELTDEPLSSFASFSCRVRRLKINIGCVSGIRAVSVTHCGELGWTLHCPNEFAQYIFEQLRTYGQSYDVQLAGNYAFNSLRIEKFYVRWGVDIDWMTTPNECGRSFRVDFNKDFIGKDALLEEMQMCPRRLFVQLLFLGHDMRRDPWPFGNEPIYRNGYFCGFTTSTSYAFTIGCQVSLGYINIDGMRTADEAADYVLDKYAIYEIEIAGKRFQVQLNLHSPDLPMVSSEHPHHYRPTQ